MKTANRSLRDSVLALGIAAAIGLPNSLYAVQVFDGANVVGMGRVIGDGGLFFQVVDIAVLPAYQGQGLGKQIMAAITE